MEVGNRKRVVFPRHNAGEAVGECGRIAYRLVICVFVVGVGTVEVALPCQRAQQREIPVAGHIPRRGCGVEAAAEGLAVVHHRPCICALERQADYSVFDTVLIYIGLHRSHPRAFAQIIFHADIELLGILGLEVAVAYLGIVEVVERRGTEYFLIPCLDGEVFIRISAEIAGVKRWRGSAAPTLSLV